MSRLAFTPCRWLLNLHIEKESWTKVLGLFLSPFKKRRFSGVLIISFTTYDSFKIFKWAGFAVCDWWARVPSSLGLQVSCFFRFEAS